MLINNRVQTTCKYNYQTITLSVLLSISPIIYAQQVPCNPSCSNTSGGYINEINRVGTLTVDNVTLSGVAPEDASGNYTYQNTVLSLGRGTIFPTVGDSELNATNLTIKSQADMNTHARAITLGSHSSNTTLTSNISDSSIIFKSADNANNYNTIGLLMESDMSGQIYNVNLTNTDMHISSNASNNTVGGIWAYSNNGFAQTNIALNNSNLNIESSLGDAYGIRTENKNNPQDSIITIQDITPGTINVKGYNVAYGISIDTLGKSATIDNKSDINVEATSIDSQAYGINTRAQTNTINTQAQNITVKALNNAYGIYAQGAGNQVITNSATINAQSESAAAGIYAKSTTSTGDIYISTVGDITVGGENATYGIIALSTGNTTIDVASTINAATNAGFGIRVDATGDTNITLHSGANVIGGNASDSAGIILRGWGGNHQITLEQGSKVSSRSERAIIILNTQNITINNNGQIIGYVELEGRESVVFNNQTAGVIDLRNFFGNVKNDIEFIVGQDNSILNNAGTIKFADENFDGTTTHATFYVETLSNSGTIDLTGKNPTSQNDLAGDTLTINGNYVSNGGNLYLNTVLDDASSNDGQGTSDRLIINGNITTGSSATKLYITPTSHTTSLGQLTTGNGIKVIDVQGTSSNNAFQLGRPLVAGAYEYTLSQGQTDDSWYLSSYYNNNDTTNSTIQYNPAMGAYLANQTAAVQMFQQTLFDRLISSSDGKDNDASKNLFWMRTKMTHGSYDSVHSSFNNRTRSYTLQMGGDLNVWALNNGGYFHLGVMGGYGDFKDTSKSDTTGTKADGKVKGYTAGIYGTYFANQDTNLGLYVDLWSQMGWYRNEISGKAQPDTKKYNSTVWSNSVELGYGIPLAISGEYQWLATPQAQFTYNYYDADNLQDKNNLRVTNNNASGLDTRLGVRFHARGVTEDLVEPFLEVNWLDTTAKNTLDFNGKSYKDGFAKDRFEAKVGLQGNINKQLSVSAQAGGQWGNNSYNNYLGQLNLNYTF